MQTDNEFEDFFRERLNGLEETPPPVAWSKIKAEIKPRRTYYREMAAVILLLILSVGTYFGVKNNSGSTKQSENKVVQNSFKEDKKQPVSNGSELETNISESAKTQNKIAAEISKTKPETTSDKGLTQPENQVTRDYNNVVSTKKSKDQVTLIVLGKKKLSKKLQKENTTDAQILVQAPVIVSRKAKITEGVEVRKRYASVPKNPESAVAISLKTQNPALAATQNQEATGNNSKQEIAVSTSVQIKNQANENGITEPEKVTNSSESKAQVIAQMALPKPDTITLKVIPETLGDSLKNQNEALAKTISEKAPELKKWAIIISGTPNIIARQLIANQNDTKHLQFSEQSKAKTPEDLGFDFQATLQRQLIPNTSLELGLGFSNLHGQINYQVYTGESNGISQTINATNNSVTIKKQPAYSAEEFSFNYTYGTIRLGLNQELVKGSSTTVFVNGGGGLNLLLDQTAGIRNVSTTGKITENATAENVFRKLNSHLYANAGLTKHIVPNLSAIIAPTVTYYLQSALKADHSFAVKPYTMGLNLGLQYKF